MRSAIRLVAEAAQLVLPLLVLTALSGVLGTGRPEVARVGATLAVFLWPGWCVAPRLLGRRGDPLERWVFAFLLSYVAYAGIALGCRVVGWGYPAFYAIFSGLAIVATLDRARALDSAVADGLRRFLPSFVCAGLLAVLAAALYARPPSHDIRFFDDNALASLEHRNFVPGTAGVRAHGLEQPQPRMLANLVHAGLAVLGEVADVSPRVVARVAAPPFLGWFALLSLTAFARAVAGSRVSPFLCALGVIAPFALFFQGHHAWYWYEYRLLNNPALDKDFTVFLLLPALGIAAWRHIGGTGARWLALFGAGALVCVWSHPMSPLYVLMTTCVLGLARLGPQSWRRAVTLVGVAAAALALTAGVVGPSDTQRSVNELVRLDAPLRPRHFSRGSYVFADPALRDAERSPLGWRDEDVPFVRPRVTFGGGLVTASAAATVLWFAIFVAVRRRRVEARPGDRLGAGGALSGAAAVGVLALGGDALGTAQLAAGGALAGTAVALIAASAWRAPTRADAAAASGDESFGAAEAAALRVQGAYLALIAGVSVAAVPVLATALHLQGSVVRLHWAYLGFFSLVFGAAWLQRGAMACSSIWSGSPLPGLLLALVVMDQVVGLRSGQPTFLSRSGVFSSAVDDRPTIGRARVDAVLATDGDRGARAILERPSWLHTEDRVLPWYRELQLLPARHALMSQAVYYREIFAEAYALKQRGDAFLDDFAAYNDYHQLRPTRRLVAWLHHRGVTLLALPAAPDQAAEFVSSLGQRWPHRIRPVAPHVWRIAPAGARDRS